MDILDKFYYGSSDVDLTAMVQELPKPITFPSASIRNRAATTVLLNPAMQDPVREYQAMVAEGEQGADYTQSMIRQDIDKRSKATNIKGVMEILADPKLTLEQKRGAIEYFKKSPLLNDAGNELFASALSGPVKGEGRDTESARISMAETFGEIYRARSTIQGLVNAHAASLDNLSFGTAAQMVELSLVPFAMNKQTGQLVKKTLDREGVASWWDTVKAYGLAGSGKADIVSKIKSLPPQEQTRFIQNLLTDIKSSSKVIFSDDSQFAQFMNLMELVESGNYSTIDTVLDNLAPLLDAVGIGAGVKSYRTAKVLKQLTKDIEAERASEVAATAAKAPVGSPEALAEVRKRKQAEAVRKIREQEAFDPSKPTPDSNAPTGPIPGILSEPTPGVPTLLGGSGIKAAPTEAPAKKIAALFQRIEMNNVVRAENPASPAKIVQQANPDKARALHAAVVASVGDEVAKALYGTNRPEAIASDILPQVTVPGGAVVTKPSNISINLKKVLDLPRRMLDYLATSGATEYSIAEKESAVAHIRNDFRSAEGLMVNDSMSSFALDGGQVKISAVYGPGEGAWSDAGQAFDQAKLALRGQGILDDEIIILRKDGIDHTPVSLEEARGVPGNYLVRIETSHEIGVSDIQKLETLDVKRNWADRLSSLVSEAGGSLTRHIFDPASTLNPRTTGPAAVATYRTSGLEKILLEEAAEYGDLWKGLDKTQQARVDDYIRDANYNGLVFDATSLIAKGFTAKELDAVKAWRKFWDTHYFLENLDLVRTLNNQEYQLFKGQQTDLVVKPIRQNLQMGADVSGNTVVGGVKLYNPTTDSITVLTKAEIADLYTKKGTIARLRRPTDFNGTVVEHIIVRNTPTEYVRKMRDTDQILNYRPGYFQIQYKSPKFIDEILERDSAGVATKWRTLAVAPDTLVAEQFRKRQVATTGKADEDFRVRNDDKALAKDSDSWWDVNSAGGRIAQRTRGKLLEDAVGINQLGSGSHVLNPVDSATRAARSIAARTITRPVLEAAKTRAIRQYAEMFPSDGMGGRRWPNSLGEIGQKGNYTSKEISDARTVYEYINYLENGYINGMDNTFKALLNSMATSLGRYASANDSKLVAGLERTLNLIGDTSGGPVSSTKNFVFFAYLASNPLRQMIIQPHQITRTVAYNPKGWISGSVTKYMMGYMAHFAGVQNVPADVKDFAKFVNDSGILSNVDKQNLVRGVLTDAADNASALTRATKPVTAVAQGMRKLGFDMGERANMLGHAAAVYDKFKRNGRNMADKAVRDEAISEMSAISYGMNFAEDMPYNQTSAALILQFMQVPHKAFLQMTNRRIDVGTRMRMLAADVLLWGGPTMIVSDMLGGDILPDNPDLRETLVWGLESMLLNHMFRTFADDDTNVDFSSFAPQDLTGWKKVIEAVMEGGLEQIILASPAANLLFKDGSKAQKALMTTARFFNVVEDVEDTPTTVVHVLDQWLNLMSGYSNAMKARALLDAQKRMNEAGVVVEEQVTKTEAWMQLFGFGGATPRDLYKLSQETFKKGEAAKEETLKMYRDIKQYYASRLNLPDSDPIMITKITSHMMRIIKDNPHMDKVFVDQLRKDLFGKEEMLIYQIMMASGLPNGVTKDQLRNAPLKDHERELMMKYLDDIRDAKETLKRNQE